MTTAVVNYDERLANIRAQGYWRVVIHPTEFEPDRVESLSRCWEIIANAMVNIRLSYPPVQPEERQHGNDYIQSGGDYPDSLEVWRFYQSGQFVHHFSMSEDASATSFSPGEHNGSAAGHEPTLNIYNALYTITEILLFARGLAHRDVLQPSGWVRIELHGVKGRRLADPRAFKQFGPYRSLVETIAWEKTLAPEALIVQAPSLAIDATMHVFERFNWTSVPRAVLEERQQHQFFGRQR